MSFIEAKKSLGQNFLKDENILAIIANSFLVDVNDLIIEVGPGKGALTKHLIQNDCHLLCYEIDKRMESILSNYESMNCQIIYDDFLKRDIKSDVDNLYEHIYVIANIPYYITTPIIEKILTSGLCVSGMTLLVQKEVAERFIATPGSREYGYFTVLLNHFFKMEKICDVPPSAFEPSPKVMSSVIKFESKALKSSISIKPFSDFLKKAFSHKRKTLRNNLKEYDSILVPFLEENNYSFMVRAEELSYEDYVSLFQRLV